MISDATLGLAVERSLITAAQAEALRAMEGRSAEPVATAAVATRAVAPGGGAADPDDEALRLVTGFADIFVTIGIGLFLGALAYIVESASGATAAFATTAVVAWVLAEFFTRRRRMALPSIALLVLFVAASFAALLSRFDKGAYPDDGGLLSAFVPLSTDGLSLILAALGTVALAACHYTRFRVPITIAAGAGALCVATLGIGLMLRPDLSPTAINGIVLCCGLAVFGLAMRFDLSDPGRATRRTDIAFWLHLLAAPMIVHTLVRFFLGGFDTDLTEAGAIGVLGVFLALGLVAVVIDRRAILVSGLVYAGIAFGALIRSAGFGGSSLLVPVVLLGLGAFILLLSAGWQPLRYALLTCLPVALARRLPHPLVASTS